MNLGFYLLFLGSIIYVADLLHLGKPRYGIVDYKKILSD
jgi:hypothetical protein